jgi:hypothetical protein
MVALKKEINMLRKFKITLFITVAFFCVFFSFYSVPDASEGDFYNRHKSEIESQILIKSQRDLIKKYDYELNDFNCKAFDFTCKMDAAQYKMAIGAIKLSHGGITSFVITPSLITENQVFKEFKNALGGFSTTMLAIFLMWQIMKVVASRYADASDGAIAINDKIIMVVVCAIFLGIYDDFFVWVLQFQEVLVSGVLKDPVKTEDIILITFINGSTYGMLIAFLIMLVMLVFSIAFMYRFVLFGLLYIVGVVAIPTGVNDEYNYFSLWLRLLINNGVTLFLQALAFSLGFLALIKNNSFSMGASFSVAMAFFLLALAVPSLLGGLGSSSGSSRAIASVVRHAMRR